MKLFIAVFGRVFGIGVLALAFVIEGLVLNVLWGWFVVPLGIEAISVGHAIGLATVVGLVAYQYDPRPVKPYSEMTESEKWGAAKRLLAYLFVRPALTYLIGWIAHFYV